MTPEDREAIYDAEIAPVLLALSKRCEKIGLGIVCLVDYTGTGKVGLTASVPSTAPAILHLATKPWDAGGESGAVNIDSFMLRLASEARKDGHSSVVLGLLGVPYHGMPTRSSHEL